jgi:hypothetical protein
MAISLVGNFEITELIVDPSKLMVLSKQHFNLEDFSRNGAGGLAGLPVLGHQ